MNEIIDIKYMSFKDFEENSRKAFKDKLKDKFSNLFRLPSFKLPSLKVNKYFKKTGKIINIIILTIVIFGLITYFAGNAFGLRINIFVDKISYKNYDHIGPNFSFKYPDYYEIDNGENKNYGESYLTGLKLKNDARTGCDIRLSKKGINFKRNDEEINNALVQETSKSAKDFQLKEYERIKIDGNDAFSQKFVFTDPLGNRTLVNQVMSGHDGNFYIFICGTGEYQYKFFEKDFQDFLNSFQWK